MHKALIWPVNWESALLLTMHAFKLYIQSDEGASDVAPNNDRYVHYVVGKSFRMVSISWFIVIRKKKNQSGLSYSQFSDKLSLSRSFYLVSPHQLVWASFIYLYDTYNWSYKIEPLVFQWINAFNTSYVQYFTICNSCQRLSVTGSNVCSHSATKKSMTS